MSVANYGKKMLLAGAKECESILPDNLRCFG